MSLGQVPTIIYAICKLKEIFVFTQITEDVQNKLVNNYLVD